MSRNDRGLMIMAMIVVLLAFFGCALVRLRFEEQWECGFVKTRTDTGEEAFTRKCWRRDQGR